MDEMAKSIADILLAYRAAVVELAVRRLDRPLTPREIGCLDRVNSLMMLEALERNIPVASIPELEALLNEPDVPSDELGCSQCGRILARLDHTSQAFEPPPEVLIVAGAIAIPNFGWFCSQDCGNEYERVRGPRFARDASGRIHYE
jgi:hypothetical protein